MVLLVRKKEKLMEGSEQQTTLIATERSASLILKLQSKSWIHAVHTLAIPLPRKPLHRNVLDTCMNLRCPFDSALQVRANPSLAEHSSPTTPIEQEPASLSSHCSALHLFRWKNRVLQNHAQREYFAQVIYYTAFPHALPDRARSSLLISPHQQPLYSQLLSCSVGRC